MNSKIVIREEARKLSHPFKDVIESIENGENVLSLNTNFEWQMKYGHVTFKVNQVKDQVLLTCMVEDSPSGLRFQTHVIAHIEHPESVIEKFFERVLINPAVKMTDSEMMVWTTEFVRRRKEASIKAPSEGSQYLNDRAIQSATFLVHELREASRRYVRGGESVMLRQMLNQTD